MALESTMPICTCFLKTPRTNPGAKISDRTTTASAASTEPRKFGLNDLESYALRLLKGDGPLLQGVRI